MPDVQSSMFKVQHMIYYHNQQFSVGSLQLAVNGFLANPISLPNPITTYTKYLIPF